MEMIPREVGTSGIKTRTTEMGNIIALSDGVFNNTTTTKMGEGKEIHRLVSFHITLVYH